VAIEPMDDRIVVITGGNSGVGLETAVGVAGLGARVVMGCRNQAKADAAVSEIRSRSGNDDVGSRTLDLGDLDSVQAFAESLRDLDRIDVLINNAGLILDHRTETAQGYEGTFGINHLGHFLLTRLVDEQLRAAPAARVINVASLAHAAAVGGMSWGDLDRHHRYIPWQVYGESKLANILHARALATRYEGTGMVAHSLHPGSVSTNFGAEGDTSGAHALLLRLGGPFMVSPATGARTSIFLASSAEGGASSGGYWSRSRRSRPAPWALRPGQDEQLWSVSDRMLAAVA
jgi:NAD(P)-dependent dehydrogenase (short-subunit alcohol dehydrogenase family)